MTDQVDVEPDDQVAQAERIVRAAVELSTCSGFSYPSAMAAVVHALGLIRERDAMADALADITHEPEWRTRGYLVQDSCTGPGTPGNHSCGRSSDHPVHRTPARVRAELEGQ